MTARAAPNGREQGAARAAVAVVSWNTRELLDECLSSLRADADAGLVEVWVHDNGSDDGSAELVAERHPWVHLVRGENIGFGRAVNRVAHETATEWIAAANADTRVTPGAIAAMLQAAADDPGAAVIAPRLLLPDGSTQRALAAFQTFPRAVACLIRLDRLSPRRFGPRINPYLDQDTARRVEWAAGAFLLVRRSAFDAVGGFDEDQWMYAEDLDLSWRLRRAGWATRYEPSAVVHHEHSAAADLAFGRDGVRERQHAALWAWSIRRLGRAATFGVAALAVVDGGLRLALYRLVSRGDEARARARGELRWGLDGIGEVRAARRPRATA